MNELNSCVIHRELLDDYHHLLKVFTNETIELSNAIGIDRAEAETMRLRAKCVEAREAIRTHDVAHGCCPALPGRYSRRQPSVQIGSSSAKIRHA